MTRVLILDDKPAIGHVVCRLAKSADFAAKAMTDAEAGSTLQVKTAEGRLLTVIANGDGRASVPGTAEPSCFPESCR